MNCPHCGYSNKEGDVQGIGTLYPGSVGDFFIAHYDLRRPINSILPSDIPTSEVVPLLGCPACRRVFIGTMYSQKED